MERRSADGWEYLRTTIAMTDPPRDLVAGMIAVVRVKITDGRARAFPLAAGRSAPVVSRASPGRFMPALTIPKALTIKPGRCPIDRKQHESRPLSDFQRLRWWCPMHPSVTADRPGASLQSMRRHGPHAPRDLVQLPRARC